MRLSFNMLLSGLYLIIRRFPFVLLFILGLASCLFVQINKPAVDIPEGLWVFFTLGVFMSVALALFLEEIRNIYLRLGLNLFAVVLLWIYTLTLPVKLTLADNYQAGVLGLVFVLLAFAGSFLKRNNDIPFWEFSKTVILRLVVAGAFSVVLMVGLSLAVLSLQELFKVAVQDKVYANLSVVCFVIFGPVYFLAGIPAGDEKHKHEYTFHSLIKILGLYIILPILAVYSLILYVYLIRIVITWELPEGWVSALVTVLSLGGFVCMFLLYPLRSENENKAVQIFSKYFPLLLLPLLVLMSVGIFRRLGDYGLTINRGYVLILNIWLIGVSVYLFLSKSRHLKWIVVSFAMVAFISSVGPWSVFSITRSTLVSEIGQLLEDAKLLENGKTIDNKEGRVELDSITTARLSGKLSYFYRDFGPVPLQPFFDKTVDKMPYDEMQARLGLRQEKVRNYFFNPEILKDNQLVEVDSFKWFVDLSYFENRNKIMFHSRELKVELKDSLIMVTKGKGEDTISIPLKTQIVSLKKKDAKRYALKDMTFEGEGYKMVVSSLVCDYKYQNDSLSITHLQGFLFLK